MDDPDAVVRTVLADVAPHTVGSTDSHDHLFIRTPLLAGQELDDLARAREQLTRFQAAGGRTVVQWTPAGLGRRLDDLRRLSLATGVQIVAATGRHRREVYPASASISELDSEHLTDWFVRDITERRCGLVKVGTGPGSLSDDERESLLAAAHASVLTGAPIAVHLEGGAGAERVLRILGEEGVAAHKVVLGHLGRNPDLQELLETASSGAWLCLDSPAPSYGTTTQGLRAQVELLASEGYAGQILLGADTTTAAALATGRDAAGLLEWTRTGPHAIDVALAQLALGANPARAWAFKPHEDAAYDERAGGVHAPDDTRRPPHAQDA
ncbi:phosphotriesterase family protein [Cellulomonas hominis]|uniref:phosphotriesterase family protein n=1 Tax=Cellulomonas hominis TaxID=156981 RepID=UPI001B9D9ABE|nr:hypothetical protein [Cellulomonas hominis]VTR76096.1 Phosphotriesterase homology protein [Cellulomonas hominis]